VVSAVNYPEMKNLISILFSFYVVFVPFQVAAEMQLLMAEEDGCYWCRKWQQDIGHIYPKTLEGKTAPLVRFDIHDAPEDVEFDKPLHFTPTFILIDDGRELGRIEGYPGEDFFWALLSFIFKDQNISLDQGE